MRVPPRAGGLREPGRRTWRSRDHMSDPANVSVLNALVDEFGDNAGFGLELSAPYRLDPASVGENWRRTFQSIEARTGPPASSIVTPPGETSPPAAAPAAPAPPAAR